MSTNDLALDICTLLRQNDPSLETLKLEEPRELLSNPNLTEFLSALSTTTVVKNLSVSGLVVQMTNEDQLNSLVSACSSVSSLQYLQINAPNLNGSVRILGSCLAECIQGSTSLKKVAVFPFVLLNNEDRIRALARAVREHPTLEELHITNGLFGSIPEGALDPLLDSLAIAPQLNCIHFSTNFRQNRDWISREAFADLLRHANGLKVLALRNFGLNDNHCRILVDHLQRTSSLRHLDLRYNSVSSEGYRALEEVVRTTNLEITSIDLDARGGDILKSMEFYLALNRAGRRLFLGHRGSRAEQVEALIRKNDQPKLTFYLIRHCNPLICDSE